MKHLNHRKHLCIFFFLSFYILNHILILFHCQTTDHHLILTAIPPSLCLPLNLLFSFSFFFFICSSGAQPTTSRPFCSNPPGRPRIPLGISYSLCFSLSPSLPVSIPPSHYLSSLHLLIHLSVCPIFSGGFFMCLFL